MWCGVSEKLTSSSLPPAMKNVTTKIISMKKEMLWSHTQGGRTRCPQGTIQLSGDQLTPSQQPLYTYMWDIYMWEPRETKKLEFYKILTQTDLRQSRIIVPLCYFTCVTEKKKGMMFQNRAISCISSPFDLFVLLYVQASKLQRVEMQTKLV